MKLKEMLAIHRSFFEDVWNRQDLDLLDRILAPEHVHHDPALPSNLAPGLGPFKQFVGETLAGFPDIHFMVADVFGSEDRTAARFTVTGTHNGTFAGMLPTGRKIAVVGIEVARFANGRIAESWSSWDSLGVMRQLGVVAVG